MIVIRFFDKLFTVVKERTCNWDSIVGVYLLLVPTIYNLTSRLKYSYWNLNTKKTRQNRNNKNKLITLHMSQIIIPQKVLLLFSKLPLGVRIISRTSQHNLLTLLINYLYPGTATNMFFSDSHPGSVVPALADHTMGLIGLRTYYAQTQWCAQHRFINIGQNKNIPEDVKWERVKIVTEKQLLKRIFLVAKWL